MIVSTFIGALLIGMLLGYFVRIDERKIPACHNVDCEFNALKGCSDPKISKCYNRVAAVFGVRNGFRQK